MQCHKALQSVCQIHFYNKYNISDFSDTFNKLVKRSYDGFLIAPVLFEAVSKLIYQIPEDIPYVFFDSYVPMVSKLHLLARMHI